MESKAYLGGGCFWCTEAYFTRMKGVLKVVSGYAGGQVVNPTYKQVCSGMTGHAELIEVTYDDSIVTFQDLLEIFFLTHNPTTLNRQGNDVGTQYRSVIFYKDEAEKTLAETYIKEKASTFWDKPIVTSLEPLDIFYSAEAYHQDYYRLNPKQGYCQIVIAPKLRKLETAFKDRLKPITT